MKKILFGLMSLMIGICLISASYAISQENDAVGGILPPDGLHIMPDNSNNMQANPIVKNSSNYAENEIQHTKDLTKTNNRTYKVVFVNGSEYVSTPEGLLPIKKTPNGTEYYTKDGKNYYRVELEVHYPYAADNTTSSNEYPINNLTSNTGDNNIAAQQNINETTNTNNIVSMESTGIPIAILLVAIIGSVIGLKRKK